MTVILHDGTNHDGVFDRIGELAGGVADILAGQGGPPTTRTLSGASWVTRMQTLITYYNTSTGGSVSLPSTIDGAYAQMTAWQSSSNGFLSLLATLAANTLINQVNADVALPSKTITAALKTLIAQMVANSDSLNASSVSIGAQSSVGSPNGNPQIVMSSKNGSGLIYQTSIFPETLTFACTQDSQLNTGLLGIEQLSVVGKAAVSNALSYLWPGGSGVSASTSAIDALKNNSNSNSLVNGSFETWSNGASAPPDNWNLLVGTGGTQISRESSPVYDGTYSVGFIGDASTLTSIAQPFATTSSTTLNAGGTPATLAPLTQYLFNGFYQMSAASPAAGVLAVELVDGSNTIIQNAQSVNNSVSVALTGVGDTNWHAINGAFQLPAVLPSTVKLRIRLSTALSSGKTVYLDRFALTKPSQLYTGGPSYAVFSGSTKLIAGDQYQVAITNTMGVLASWLERFFNLRSLGMQFPYAGSPTVPDSVVA